jgi:hypothetical protein
VLAHEHVPGRDICRREGEQLSGQLSQVHRTREKREPIRQVCEPRWMTCS